MAFIPGLRLAGKYYTEVARPILAQAWPSLAYSAALIGWGSDVLGFDSERSTDHNWGSPGSPTRRRSYHI